MNHYLVRFSVESGLKSHLEKTVFNKNNIECELLFPSKEHKGKIQASIKLHADNHKDAVEQARMVLDELLDSISLIMDSSMYSGEVNLILKGEVGSAERIAFRTRVKEKIGGLYIRDASRQSIEQLWNMPKDAKIENALRWFRLGHRSRTFHEQFIYYWLAIERFVGESQITRPCSQCGYPHAHPGIDKDKIKTLMRSAVAITNDDFKKIWDIRNDVFHGRKHLNKELHDRIRTKINLVFKTLEKAFSDTFPLSYKISLTQAEYFMKKDNRHMYLICGASFN